MLDIWMEKSKHYSLWDKVQIIDRGSEKVEKGSIYLFYQLGVCKASIDFNTISFPLLTNVKIGENLPPTGVV